MKQKILKNIYAPMSFLLIPILVIQGFFLDVHTAEAATFDIQVGSYVGDGLDNRAITGLGFQPDLVLIKDDTTAGDQGMLFKTSAMTGEQTLALAEVDAGTLTLNNHIQSLDSDGFTVGMDADVNTANLMYYYVAIGGSDCSNSGTFCVGSYTGNGTTQTITSVGFQPDMVGVRSLTNTEGVWRSSTMAGTVSNYFSALAELAGGGITSLTAAGFDIGNNARVNTNTTVYYYFAFKEVPGFFDVDTYTGNGVDNRNITTTSFQPDAVFIKPITAFGMVGSIREHYGDRSFLMGDLASAVNHVQELLSAGSFQVGNSTSVNTTGTVHHYFAFGGAPNHSSGSGTYSMVQGTYTGTGAGFSLTGLGFAPDLVIVKGNTAQLGVFRTRLMAGDRTAHLASATTVFAGGIVALGVDGFSLGTSVITNTAGVTYHYTAFGNAARIDKSGGASDFMIGQYIGTGRDNQDVRALPFGPDIVFAKQVGAALGVWRTQNQVGDLTLFLSATAQIANVIQALNSDGFQMGTNASINSSGTYDYFAFKLGDRLTTGTYTGNATARDIATIFQPDYLWIKKIAGGTTRGGISRSSEATGDFALSFLALASFTGRVTNLILNGFSLGTQVESNETTFSYQYVVWNNKFYTQQAYRFFENTDSTNVGSPLAAQDTPAEVPSITDPIRLRLLMRLDKGNLFQNAEEFKLQFAEQSGTCDTGFSGESYTDVAPIGTDIAYYNNTTPTHNTALTPNAGDPTDGLRIIANQSYNEQNPITNSVGSVIKNQTAQFDFSLITDAAPPETTYCLRLVYSDGTLLDTYTNIPEITSANIPQEISFDISDTSIGFGTLDVANTRYASGDSLGSASPITAHTITASTNGVDGYSVMLNGTSLTCMSCIGLPAIASIGPVATAPTPGTEQYGLRSSVVSGTGTVSTPYSTSNYAFDSGSFPDELATGTGDNVLTTYDVEYIANITSGTQAGMYESVLTYTITPHY
jgi:hypothetical protein